jgi:uncharacterized protein (TIGR00369 family)
MPARVRDISDDSVRGRKELSYPAETVEINCFGCAPANPAGLKIMFDCDSHKCRASFALGTNYESYPGVVHGGIVATILDEAMSQAVYQYGSDSAFTVGLRIRYARPMATEVPHVAFAEGTSADDAVLRAAGRIVRETGELVAAATGSFYPVSESGLATMRRGVPKASRGPLK